ncbi:hypothetical protein JTE90_020764 [Oedothorax gibbosus]|uniref:Uncharacterized protein n=1 Tax=Oedothorax gibbosus TaxID=931172 RepID=A0AAV6TY15_9ARAC|nr:hypothetical protein JTE90_020764 [Oedothorax gibbosus]
MENSTQPTSNNLKETTEHKKERHGSLPRDNCMDTMENSTQPTSNNLKETTEHKKERHGKRNLCRTLKFLIFVGCLSGFSFQTVEFLTNFFKYSTVVNIEVKEVDEFPLPALTLCSKYFYNFGEFCEKYNESCISPKDTKSFCREQPRKCNRKGTKSKVVTPKYFPSQYTVPGYKPLREITYKAKDPPFIHNPEMFDVGPYYLRSKHNGYEVCFTSGSGFGPTGLRTTPKMSSRLYLFYAEYLNFTQEYNIHFPSDAEPSATLYIHSPFQSFKKYAKKLELHMHKQYFVYVRLEMQKLLPPPYETNCENYEDLWRKDHTAPVSREMCEHLCLNRWNEKYFEHSGRHEWFIEDECVKLLKGDRPEDEFVNVTGCKCRQNCKDECVKLNYDFNVLSEKGTWVDDDMIRDGYFRRVDINIWLEKDNVRVLSFKPQFMDVEVFSYIGGFIGCWLGISLWTSTGIFWQGINFLFRSYNKGHNKPNFKGKDII